MIVFIVLGFDVYDAAKTATQTNFDNVIQLQTYSKYLVQAKHVSRIFHIELQSVIVDVDNHCVYNSQDGIVRNVFPLQHKSPIVKQYESYIEIKCADQEFFDNHKQKTHKMMNNGLSVGISLCAFDLVIVSLIWIFCAGWCKCKSIKQQNQEKQSLLINEV
ncbi:Hypothetical_protein [Hexamita inflata]|uniref:Hypothetical_protein n=1 Tax=Hexamita inflata TaxID=28002 RepID=A0AA86PVY4_9EUKA|nr:Hypothetical protein HINF_LOCUS34909 [Hexamita inflata]